MNRRKKHKRSLGFLNPASAAFRLLKRKRAERAPKTDENDKAPERGEPKEEINTSQTKKGVLNETDKKVIRVLIYVFSGLILSGVSYLIVRRIIRKNKKSNAEKVSLNDDTPENFAKRLKMAFDNDGWWGTDVEGVRRVFVQLPSKEVFKKTVDAYKTLNLGKQELIPDLTDELTTTEYYEMQNILAAKPDKTGGQLPNSNEIKAKAYARRLNSALNYKVMGIPGTDEDAIREVLTEIPTKKMWVLTTMAYQKDFGLKLDDDLDADIGWFDFSWREIILNKPRG